MLETFLSTCQRVRWVLVLTGLFVFGVFALTCHRQAPAPLPAPVARLVERHQVQGAVDSAEIQRLKRSAQAVNATETRNVVSARASADSGNYRVAYAAEDTALKALDREVALLDVALTRSESRAISADSVIAAVLPLAESREPPCRILWLVPCPSRRAVAVATAAITATAIVAIPRLVHP
jgi:hypothetical protein